jgi:hypothetical protein
MVPWTYTEPERIVRVHVPRKETVPPWMERSVPRPEPGTGTGTGTGNGEVGEWRLAAREVLPLLRRVGLCFVKV